MRKIKSGWIFCLSMLVVSIACYAAERGATRLLNGSAMLYVTTNAPVRIVWDRDETERAVMWDVCFVVGTNKPNESVTILGTYGTSTPESRAIMLLPRYVIRTCSAWVQAVGTNGQRSDWAAGPRFIKLN